MGRRHGTCRRPSAAVSAGARTNGPRGDNGTPMKPIRRTSASATPPRPGAADPAPLGARGQISRWVTLRAVAAPGRAHSGSWSINCRAASVTEPDSEG